MRCNLQFALIMAFCVVSPGCRLFDVAWQTTVVEPIHYSRNACERISRRRFLGLAEQSLEQAKANVRAESDEYDCEPFSIDYQQGFIDGFVMYLEAGGTAVQPLPPRRYWKVKYQNPVGLQRISEWNEGYRHGRAAAEASNYRSFVEIPLTDSVVMDTLPYRYGRIATANEIDIEDVTDDQHAKQVNWKDSRPQIFDAPSAVRLPNVNSPKLTATSCEP